MIVFCPNKEKTEIIYRKESLKHRITIAVILFTIFLLPILWFTNCDIIDKIFMSGLVFVVDGYLSLALTFQRRKMSSYLSNAYVFDGRSLYIFKQVYENSISPDMLELLIGQFMRSNHLGNIGAIQPIIPLTKHPETINGIQDYSFSGCCQHICSEIIRVLVRKQKKAYTKLCLVIKTNGVEKQENVRLYDIFDNHSELLDAFKNLNQ